MFRSKYIALIDHEDVLVRLSSSEETNKGKRTSHKSISEIIMLQYFCRVFDTETWTALETHDGHIRREFDVPGFIEDALQRYELELTAIEKENLVDVISKKIVAPAEAKGTDGSLSFTNKSKEDLSQSEFIEMVKNLSQKYPGIEFLGNPSKSSFLGLDIVKVAIFSQMKHNSRQRRRKWGNLLEKSETHVAQLRKRFRTKAELDLMRKGELFPYSRSCQYVDGVLEVVDQRFLPHDIKILKLKSFAECRSAIRTMIVRGAPLIGVVAGYGMMYAIRSVMESKRPINLKRMAQTMKEARPTAVNLSIAVDRLMKVFNESPKEDILNAAYEMAKKIEDEEVQNCRRIGVHGVDIIENLFKEKKRTINILTHCNAGFLGCVSYGSVTSPLYLAHSKGIPIHVFVSETRPRNQGALTCWELTNHGVPNTYIVDNSAGLLMRKGNVDVCFVGADRVTLNGDVANKIGTYMKALAAKANDIPFYSVLTKSAFDLNTVSGEDIVIEERSRMEVARVNGLGQSGEIAHCQVTPYNDTEVLNPAFDVTPHELVTGLLTEEGVIAADRDAISKTYIVEEKDEKMVEKHEEVTAEAQENDLETKDLTQ